MLDALCEGEPRLLCNQVGCGVRLGGPCLFDNDSRVPPAGHQLVVEGFRSASFELAVADGVARRQQRFQWVVAGLLGAVVALLWRKGLDRA